MRLTSTGHQGWLFSSGGNEFLIDPLLGESFGSSEQLRFCSDTDVFSEIEDYGRVLLIILSTCHFQKMDLRTLQSIPKNIPIVVHSRFPQSAIDLLSSLGFNVDVKHFYEKFEKNGVEFCFVIDPKRIFFVGC